MKKLNIFLDSSALIAGVLSETGAAHVLLLLGESEDILLTLSEMVIIESERSIALKSPITPDCALGRPGMHWHGSGNSLRFTSFVNIGSL